MPAGQLKHRISWQQRIVLSDGYGNEEGDFQEAFIRSSEIRPSLGIETVNAARLAGQQPVDITVRRDSQTLLIKADWRAVDVNEGTIYALTSPAMDMKQNRMYLTIKAVAGVAQ